MKTKTIIITDPCYILNNEDWDELCEKYLGEESEEGDFEFNVAKKLQEISGDEKAVVGQTGFGDWENEIDGQTFFADSGMVCVVEETDKLKKYMAEPLPFGGAARLKVPETAFYELSFLNSRWTKVIIWEEDFSKKIAESADELSWE